MSRLVPILDQYYNPRDISYSSSLRDLLTDILHYCDSNNISFERKLRAAHDVWLEEKMLDDGLPLDK